MTVFCWVEKMAQWERELATKHNNLGSIPQTTWQKEKTASRKLFSDFQVCTVAQTVDKIPFLGEI